MAGLASRTLLHHARVLPPPLATSIERARPFYAAPALLYCTVCTYCAVGGGGKVYTSDNNACLTHLPPSLSPAHQKILSPPSPPPSTHSSPPSPSSLCPPPCERRGGEDIGGANGPEERREEGEGRMSEPHATAVAITIQKGGRRGGKRDRTASFSFGRGGGK